MGGGGCMVRLRYARGREAGRLVVKHMIAGVGKLVQKSHEPYFHFSHFFYWGRSSLLTMLPHFMNVITMSDNP